MYGEWYWYNFPYVRGTGLSTSSPLTGCEGWVRVRDDEEVKRQPWLGENRDIQWIGMIRGIRYLKTSRLIQGHIMLKVLLYLTHPLIWQY